MKRTLSVSAIAIVLALASAGPLMAIDESKVREFTLENGLHVITYEMHTAPVIYSRLTYDVGAKYEPYGQTGISHIVEHMMFKGTERFPRGTIADLVSSNGGIFNAFTSSDITVYYELLPRNRIELAFDIESERMHRCEFDPGEFASEIGVIAQERRQRVDNSAKGMRREEVNTLIFKNHPYRNPVIGWMEDIRSITRDQAYAWYRKYYTPNNATLVLCGDFETEEILGQVRRYFGDITRGPELEKPRFYRVPAEGKKILEFKHSDILDEAVNMYFQAPGRFDEDGPALYVAGTILCGRSATSRLYKRLVRRDELCSSVGGGLSFSKDPRTFSIGVRLLPGVPVADVEAAIREEIDSLATVPVDEYDLQKIKNRIRFDEITGDQYTSDVGNRLGLYENYVGWEYINEWTRMVQSVTGEDILRVTGTYLQSDNLVVCYSSPDTTATKTKRSRAADEEAEDDPDGMETGGEHGEPGQGADETLPEVLELYGPRLDDIIAPNPIAPMIDSLVLDNGVPVYLLENHDFPTVLVMGFIKTGRIQENMERPGIRGFTEAMLLRGTEDRSFDEILEEISFTPYSIDISQSWNTIGFTGYSLREDIDRMLGGLMCGLVEPSFPEEQMEKIRPRLVAAAEDFKTTDRMKAFYGMFEAVFEGHQYAVSHAGDPDVYRELTRDDLVAFHDRYYSPDRMKLVVVGDFDRDWIEGKLNGTLGGWRKESRDPMLPFGRIDRIEGKHVIVFGNPEYEQCRVDIAFNPVSGGIMESNPDLEAIGILEHILCGSSLTSRMGIELRDRQGLSYGIKSNLWIRDEGGYWNIRTNTDKTKVARMIRGMFEEIRKVQEDGVTAGELEKAKARKIALLSLYVRTPDDVGAVVYDQIKNGRPLDYFDTRRERIMAVTLEDVRAAANRYLDTKNYIIAVSGDLDENALDEFKE
ncbi:MAG: insulinase family protein [Candidatus Krumholzibacteriota bacterium]|nr:insulinase family protein [Candidatus Krumholzibacteriota bacterium]